MDGAKPVSAGLQLSRIDHHRPGLFACSTVSTLSGERRLAAPHRGVVMSEVRMDDVRAELEVRSDDFQETKSVVLPADAFRINDETGKAEFVDDKIRADVLDRVSEAILLVVAHKHAEAGPEESSA